MTIPMLSDTTHNICKQYGCYIDGNDEEEGKAMRATYIIDSEGILRHMSMNDLPVGRDVDEVLRLVEAFQHADKYGEVCPASWKPGKSTMKADAESAKTKDYFENVHAAPKTDQAVTSPCLGGEDSAQLKGEGKLEIEESVRKDDVAGEPKV